MTVAKYSGVTRTPVPRREVWETPRVTASSALRSADTHDLPPPTDDAAGS